MSVAVVRLFLPVLSLVLCVTAFATESLNSSESSLLDNYANNHLYGKAYLPLIFELSEEEQRYLADKKQLKVCIDPDWMPFEKNDRGRHIGLTADYLALFSHALAVPIVMVPSQSWNESLQLVAERRCDLLSATTEAEDRKAYLDFTESYFSSPPVLAVRLQERWSSSLHELGDKKVGVIEGYAAGAYLRKEYPKLQVVEVDSLDDGLRLVQEGELYGFIDVLATIGYHIQKDYFGSLKIGAKAEINQPLNIGTRNDEPLLKGIFNKLIAAVPAQEHQRILNNWVSVSIEHDDPNQLTSDEVQFLRTHPVIRFRARSAIPPFEFVAEGEPVGVAIDFMSLIAEKVGFKVEYVLDNHHIDDPEHLSEGDENLFDTILYSVKTPELEKHYFFSESYLSYPVITIINKNSTFIGTLQDLVGRHVAVEKGFATVKWLNSSHPDINFIEADTTKEALALVNTGRADAYVGNYAVASYAMATERLDNLKIALPTQYDEIKYRLIAPKKWPELISILDKGYRQITPNEHAVIQQKWFSLQTIEKTDYKLVMQVTAGALAIIGWVFFSHRRLRAAKQEVEQTLAQLIKAQLSLEKKNKQLEKLSITDRLTGLFNRGKLEDVLTYEAQKAQRYAHTFGVVLIDLDHFKQINDTLGHHAGDQVLVEVAELFSQSLRERDTIGRWGGEEFLLICPHTDYVEVLKIAEQLRLTIASYQFSAFDYRTASFGVTVYRDGDTVESLVRRADEALYQAKAAGRNKVMLKR